MSRDPARIDRMLSLLADLWRAHPDWRLGQLVVNALCCSRPRLVAPEVFNAEDDEVEAGLVKLADFLTRA